MQNCTKILLCYFIVATMPLWADSRDCIACHTSQYNDWKSSHHAHSMQVANASTVQGNFDGASFASSGEVFSFFKTDDEFWLKVEDLNGTETQYQVTHTFGVYPLQQYLLELPDGRYQATTIAWDDRPAEEGGQKWFNSHPEAGIALEPEDPLHWSGSFFNWNTRCAKCHSTNVERNYAVTTNTFETTFSEINVSCESCHADTELHLELARSQSLSSSNTGFDYAIQPPKAFVFTPESAIAQPVASESDGVPELLICADCHSRRTELAGSESPNHAFYDHAKLNLATPPAYHLDGQINEENFVLGSFLQSSMSAAGVTCSNCHNPHSGALKLPGNLVCAQCHKSDHYDTPEHHFHNETSSGSAQCVDCHMPGKLYMGIDYRRDHSLRIPRPDLSDALESPNACTQCHSSQTNRWAAEAIENHSGKGPEHQPLDLLVTATTPDIDIDQWIDAVAASSTPSMQRAMLMANTSIESERQLQIITANLRNSDPIVRMGAVQALAKIPLQQRAPLLAPCLEDQVRAVRFVCMDALVELLQYDLPEEWINLMMPVVNEMKFTYSANLDSAPIAVSLGSLHMHTHDQVAAIEAFQQALVISPYYNPALLNLAQLARQNREGQKAIEYSERALKYTPDDPTALYSLALSHVTERDYSSAVAPLEAATGLAPDNLEYTIAYILVLERVDEMPTARRVLSDALLRFRDNDQLLSINEKFNRLN